MPSVVRRALAATAAASLLVLIAVGGQAQAAKSTKNANATSQLRALVNQTKALPRNAASRSAKARLLSRARRARAVARRSPCTAVRQLSAYRKTLGATRIRSTVRGKKAKQSARKRLAGLGPTSLKASRKLLSDKRTRRCGGGVTVPTIKGTKTSILRSDANGMRLRVQLPALRFAAQ